MRKPVCLPTRFNNVRNVPHMPAFQQLFNVSSCRLHDIFRLPSDISSNAKESCQHHQTSMQRSFLVFVVEFITNISPTSQHHQAWKSYLHRTCTVLLGFLCNNNCEVLQFQWRDILEYPLSIRCTRYNQMCREYDGCHSPTMTITLFKKTKILGMLISD